MKPVVVLLVLLSLAGCSLHRNSASRSPSPASPSPSAAASPTPSAEPSPSEGSAAAAACQSLLPAVAGLSKTLGDVRAGKTTPAAAAPELQTAVVAVSAAARQAGAGPVATSLTKLAADLEATRIAAQNGGDYRTPLSRVVTDATAASAACGSALATP